MVAEDTENSKLSKFSLAIALDSGWFESDLSLAESFSWGRNNGCDFVNNVNCHESSAKEICRQNQIMSCSKDFKHKLSCSKTGFSDNCRISIKPKSCMEESVGSFYETFGELSKCHLIEANNQQFSGCFGIRCDEDKLSYSIFMEINTHKIELKCKTINQKVTIPGYSIDLICDNPEEYCKIQDKCQCNDR
jgi:hypothetical protein